MTATTPIDYSKLSKDELYAILCPPTPELSDKDIRLARARYVVDNFIYDMMAMAEGLRLLSETADTSETTLNDPASEEARQKKLRRIASAMEAANRFEDQLSKDVSDEGDPWDAFAGHFDKYHLDGIYSMHGGDCTAIACTCERCYAEQLFDLPWSASWRGKAEGHRIYSAYSRAVAAEKAAQVDPTCSPAAPATPPQQ